VIGNTLVQAMLFNSLFPAIEFFAFWCLRFLKRAWDRSIFSLNSFNTKKTSLQQYIDVYSGPVYLVHFKYSSIMNVTFITFMYGLAMPILFPIAFFSFMVIYLAEKACIYYSYRQPPMYDNKLNDSVLLKLTYSPLFMLGFGFWMLTNPEMFSNEVVWKQRYNDDPTEHVWTDVFFGNMLAKNPQALPIFIAFWFFLITIFFRNFLYSAITKCFPSMKIGAFHIEEDLPNYFAAVDDHDRNWSIKEEENSRNNLRMTIMMDETLEKLKTTEPSRKCLQGVHCYDILANLSYVD